MPKRGTGQGSNEIHMLSPDLALGCTVCAVFSLHVCDILIANKCRCNHAGNHSSQSITCAIEDLKKVYLESENPFQVRDLCFHCEVYVPSRLVTTPCLYWFWPLLGGSWLLLFIRMQPSREETMVFRPSRCT